MCQSGDYPIRMWAMKICHNIKLSHVIFVSPDYIAKHKFDLIFFDLQKLLYCEKVYFFNTYICVNDV